MVRVIATVVVLVISSSAAQASEKSWSGDSGSRLEWGDFEGTPPDPLPQEGDVTIQAESAAGHKVGSYSTMTDPTDNGDGTWSCTSTPTTPTVSTIFETSQSWSDPDSQTKELLDHEQGHFDLAEKFRREIYEKQLTDFGNSTFTGTGATQQEACDDADQKAQDKLDAIQAEKSEKLAKLQQDYDEQTKHGTDAAEQAKWRKKLNENLGMGDKDKDAIPNQDDNCPEDPNQSQTDENEDGVGDACQEDSDSDGSPDTEENRLGSNPADGLSTPEDLSLPGRCGDLLDNDLDGFVDALDDGCVDSDGDAVSQAIDNCPEVGNPTQLDNDLDGLGDDCDGDDDDDGIGDGADDCALLYDPLQQDADLDGIGDTCDDDLDADGWKQLCIGNPYSFCTTAFDNCPLAFNPDQADSDGDLVGDVCDATSVPSLGPFGIGALVLSLAALSAARLRRGPHGPPDRTAGS